MKDATVLFSHGSLLCGAGEALRAHAERLRAQGLTPLVAVGYLNYSEPAFIDAVAECVEAGATRILVTPYFLVPGYFVKVDLPKAVAEAQSRFPEVVFVVAEAICFDERLADAVIESANGAVGPSGWREDLRRASQFCRPNVLCPLFGTPNCPKQSVPVEKE